MECECAILPCVACPTLQYFSTLSHKRHDFRNNDIEQKCVLRVSLQLLSEIFFILRIIVRDMIENVYGLKVTYPLFLFDLNET